MKHLFFKVFHILKLVTWLFPDVQLKETPKSSRRSGLVVLGYNKEEERRGQLHKGMQKENLNKLKVGAACTYCHPTYNKYTQKGGPVSSSAYTVIYQRYCKH